MNPTLCKSKDIPESHLHTEDCYGPTKAQQAARIIESLKDPKVQAELRRLQQEAEANLNRGMPPATSAYVLHTRMSR